MKPVSSSTEAPSAIADEPADAVAPAAEPPGIDDRLSHLFRASLKSGRIHPLYLPILRYRQTRHSA